MSEISLLLNCVGLLTIPIIAGIFISMDVNTNRGFEDYCKKLNDNNCSIITGSPTDVQKYELNISDEELIVFSINGTEFDTANLYRTKNGLSKDQIDSIEESDSVTVKYIEDEDTNWIVSIRIDS